MTGLEQLKRALEIKQGTYQPQQNRVSIPDPIVYAVEGTHLASDGKPYTIKYE
jgi:hypothetical protein